MGKDGGCGGVVKRARRLVGEDIGRLGQQCPGDGHTLLLPAGKLRGQAALQPAKAERVKDLRHLAACRAPAGKARGQGGIALGVEGFQQVIVLENKGSLLAPRRIDSAGGGLIEPG